MVRPAHKLPVMRLGYSLSLCCKGAILNRGAEIT